MIRQASTAGGDIVRVETDGAETFVWAIDREGGVTIVSMTLAELDGYIERLNEARAEMVKREGN